MGVWTGAGERARFSLLALVGVHRGAGCLVLLVVSDSSEFAGVSPRGLPTPSSPTPQLLYSGQVVSASWPRPLTLRTVLARNLLIELPFMHPLAK